MSEPQNLRPDVYPHYCETWVTEIDDTRRIIECIGWDDQDQPWAQCALEYLQADGTWKESDIYRAAKRLPMTFAIVSYQMRKQVTTIRSEVRAIFNILYEKLN